MFKNNIHIFACILLISIMALSSFASEPTYVPQSILIFLDDSERDYGIVSDNVVTALAQNAGPIIASASLMTNIFSEYNEIAKKTDDPKALVSKFRVNRLLQQTQEKKDDPDLKKEEKYIILKALAFDPNKWVIKKINPALYLFIPYHHLQALKINIQDVNKKIDPANTSETELQLGLKVNHMETVTLETIINQKVEHAVPADYFVGALYNPHTKKGTIFCTRSEYHEKKMSVQPVWSIYMGGHGTMYQYITGVRLEDFKNILDFLEHKITTHLLLYNSCYAAGINTEILYKDAKSPIQKTYSFPIITQALTDAPTQGTKAYVKLDSNNNLILEMYENFPAFLKEVTTLEPINYEKASAFTIPIEQIAAIDFQRWGNVPQIKLPGLEWFSVIDSNKNIVSIGSILAKARDPQKSLNVINFFKTDPEALLLYAHNIPFELIIDTKNMEAIISMIPGDATHKIKKISSSTLNANQILNWFMAINNLDPRKIFFIEEINNIKNVIVYNNKIPGNIQFNVPDRYENYAFFMDNNAVYIQEPSNQIYRDKNQKKYEQPSNPVQPANDKQKNQYQELLNKIQGKIAQLGSFTFKRSEFIRFPSIKDSTIIQKIIGTPESDVYISDIVTFLKSAIESPQAVVWVKEISGKYDTLDINIPGISRDAQITIADVVFDKNKGIFFTYQDSFYHGKNKIDYDYRNEYQQRMISAYESSEPSKISAEDIKKIKEILSKKITTKVMEQPKQKEKITTEKKETGLKKTSVILEEPIKQIITKPSPLQTQNTKAFKMAVLQKDINKVKALIEQGIDVNADLDGTTPLIGAVKNRWPEIVRMLIARGANVNGKDRSGNFPFTITIFDQLPEITKTLIANGANIDKEDKQHLLFLALFYLAPLEIVRWIIDHGANVNAKQSGTPLLTIAVNRQLPDVVQLLIERGADVNAKDENGKSPLYWAIQRYSLETIKLLLDHGATTADISDETLSRNPTIKQLIQEYVKQKK